MHELHNHRHLYRLIFNSKITEKTTDFSILGKFLFLLLVYKVNHFWNVFPHLENLLLKGQDKFASM